MSWSLSVDGTVDELRAEVHRHETEYWRHMPLEERLAVHHLVGHAIESAEEYGRKTPPQRFHLEGGGHQWHEHFNATLTLNPLADDPPPADPAPTDPPAS
ncbi:MAG: hypothetical protein ACYCT1_08235 [Steroidobacteraceae bacterium]